MMQSNLNYKVSTLASPLLFPQLTGRYGPATHKRLVWFWRVYAALFSCGATLLLLGPAPWAGFALGLIAPGAGFASAWFAAFSLAAFLGALVVWFATGNALLPPLVWIGSAGLAFTLDPPGLTQQLAVPGAVLFGLCGLWIWQRAGLHQGQHKRDALNAYLTARAECPDPTPPDEELSADDLSRLRLLLDRALQPVTAFDGFEWRDQFQTAAIRYQLNFMSYALSMVQANYTPAFKGYLHTAQDRLLAKQQDPRVWRYWALENLWGNGDPDPDPVRRDNIMYSGFVAAQMAFRANACAYPMADTPAHLRGTVRGRHFDYDQSDIIELLTRQTEASDFGLLSCEPNWIYPLCNLITATAIRSHAAHHATDHWDRIARRFSAQLEAEFVAVDGQLVPFRSAYIGIAAPGIGGQVMQSFPCLFPNAINPQMADRQWQALKFRMRGRDWRRAIWPVDVGNYGLSRAAGYAATAAAAREMGDMQVAQDMLSLLEQDCPTVVDAGVRHRENASLWALSNEVMARATPRNGLLHLVTTPHITTAPYIEVADYAQVLVAKAKSGPDHLDATLYPRQSGQPQSITVAGLRPNRPYALHLASPHPLIADAQGRATIALQMTGRTPLRLQLQR